VARLLSDQLEQPEADVAAPVPPPAAVLAEGVAPERTAAPGRAEGAAPARAEPALAVVALVVALVVSFVVEVGAWAAPPFLAKHGVLLSSDIS
jgi:hypothetical protein